MTEETKPTEPGKLPLDFKERWLMALRSGKFIQCKERLYKEDSKFPTGAHCVLGVAYQLALGDKKIGKELTTIPVDNNSCVPEILQGSAGDKSRRNEIPNKLFGMNDQGMTFHELADWIDENL